MLVSRQGNHIVQEAPMATATTNRNQHKLPQVTEAGPGDTFSNLKLRLASFVGLTPEMAEQAVYTQDGFSVNRQEWCGCDGEETVVYYEVYDVEGTEESPELASREAHGYACKDCRRIVQVG